ncbi:VOC family protein [Pseudodesulfovibrio portus]|uniref:VOC domain-containing protein n=1 Tax=Pseudodesulfovibrio portus TaxID=231439 RepID=A0ABM8APU0_9BACT|nr:VOC family protein [Pseudodesulfovibrio portus]BDQ33351.1 hypothetical protein JCM14722_08930 [Pseudodesulfovibrio portus]
MPVYSRTHGVFSWNELITSDLDSAREFYGNLLGWTFMESQTIHGQPYFVALKDETLIAGLMTREGNVPDDTPLCWDPYITVDDIDESARRVAELGGTVELPPTDIPNVGRFCVVRDPQGVSLNLVAYLDKAAE